MPEGELKASRELLAAPVPQQGLLGRPGAAIHAGRTCPLRPAREGAAPAVLSRLIAADRPQTSLLRFLASSFPAAKYPKILAGSYKSLPTGEEAAGLLGGLRLVAARGVTEPFSPFVSVGPMRRASIAGQCSATCTTLSTGT